MPRPENHLLIIPLIGGAFFLSWIFVYVTGGTKFSHLHTVYIPILIAAYRYNMIGGALGGLTAMVIMGPFMPIDTELGTPQPLINWLSRGFYLVAVGTTAGALKILIIRSRRHLFRIENYDSTTDLPLLGKFRKEFERRLTNSSSLSGLQGVLGVEIQEADDLQASFGTAPYEDLVRGCAERVRQLVPESAYMCRYSPNTFLCLLSDTDSKELRRIARHIADGFAEPVIMQDLPILVKCDVGVAVYPEHGSEPEDVIRASQAALLQARDTRSPVHVFSPREDMSHRDNLTTLSDLDRALRFGELTFHAQPKVAAATGEVIGAELLVRWEHPERGMVPPGLFIGLAERSRLMTQITRAAFDAASVYIGEAIRTPDTQSLRFGINASVTDLSDPGFPTRLASAFRYDSDRLTRLEVEITETAMIENMDSIAPTLQTLRDMGVRIAIDDFGTGYSSLVYLTDIPADTMKIDQTFVRQIGTSAKTAVLIQRMIEIGRDLGLETVAEGVETAEQAEWLNMHGCDTLQGYHFSRPLPPDRWWAWFRTHSARINAGKEAGTDAQSASASRTGQSPPAPFTAPG